MGVGRSVFAELHDMTCLVATPSLLAAFCFDSEVCEFSIITLINNCQPAGPYRSFMGLAGLIERTASDSQNGRLAMG